MKTEQTSSEKHRSSIILPSGSSSPAEELSSPSYHIDEAVSPFSPGRTPDPLVVMNVLELPPEWKPTSSWTAINQPEPASSASTSIVRHSRPLKDCSNQLASPNFENRSKDPRWCSNSKDRNTRNIVDVDKQHASAITNRAIKRKNIPSTGVFPGAGGEDEDELALGDNKTSVIGGGSDTRLEETTSSRRMVSASAPPDDDKKVQLEEEEEEDSRPCKIRKTYLDGCAKAAANFVLLGEEV